MRAMTGYAYVFKKRDSQSVEVILRSINFKYLEVFVRNLAGENILLEEKIKREIKNKIYRGKIEAHVFVKGTAGTIEFDEKALGKYIAQLRRISKKYKLQSDLRLSDILNLPQATWQKERRGSEESVVVPAVREALNKLIAFKIREGHTIKREMIANLRRLTENARKIKIKKPKAKTSDAKTDIDEEIALISFYINKLKNQIHNKKDMLKGKSIDFLTQEILRELNASASKTKKKELASLIIESKNYLERIREQAQNIE